MERYEVYKDSRVEWLGEIPAEWEVKKLKYEVQVNPLKDNLDQTSDELVTFLPMDSISENGEADCSIKKPVSSVCNGFTFFRKNDVIVAKITPCFENGKCVILSDLDTSIGFGSTEFHVLRPKERIVGKFLYYITKSEVFMQSGEAFMYGAAGQKRVPSGFISDFPLVLPNVDEQTTIANFLDRKTAEIDALIAQKERLLELYEEEKTAIINHAVTKGLDPNAEFKESGIDWLGEIPVGWGIIKLRYLSNIKTGEKDTENRQDDGQHPFYVRSQTIERISTYSYDGEAILTAGDGVGVGKVFHYVNGKFDYHQRVYKVSDFEGVIGKYVFYYMQINFHKEVIRISAKSTVDSLRMPMLQNFPVCLPHKEDEQTAIVQHIEAETSRIDVKIAKTQRIIELQKEYRTALISEVVTGKIKVSHLTANGVTN